MHADIVDEARRQLATGGAASLSLRAVARELGVVSSAVYRYVASRDELLTLLIVEAYGRLAADAEQAQAAAGDDPRARWRAACGAIRRWARAHPHEYALLYGTPVPGYAAPADTIGPASRVYETLIDPVRRTAAGRRAPGRTRAVHQMAPALTANAVRLAVELDLEHVDPRRILDLLGAVAEVFGLVSFELFGHTNNVVDDHDAWFADRVEAMADALQLAR
jgi:AcrR family transcriptional regulator